jgi:cation:H+ antiporter
VVTAVAPRPQPHRLSDMSGLALAPLLAILGASVVLVVLAGTWLARAGDEIAEHTGLGRIFIGALLIAVATSLPELGTDVTAALSDAPDLAIGDLLGSSMANMAILAIVDLRYRGRVLPLVELGHTRIAAIAIGLTALAAIGVSSPPGVDVLGVGITPILLFLGYVASLAWFRRVPPIGVAMPTPTPFREPRRFGQRWTGMGPQLRRFTFGAVALLVAAPAVALATEEVADRSNLSQGFLGVTLLATATSLPELATSLAAVKLGAYDLAVGNLFGSNAANMAMIVFVDAAYRPGPILAAVGEVHLVAAFGAILLMALAVAGIVSGQANRAHRFEPDSIVLLVAYVGCVAAVVAAA